MIKTKKLGFWMMLSLVIGNMIGSGIFMLPASLAKYGSISLFGWVFTGLGTLMLALVFCRLAAHNPLAGGPYAYAHQGFGDYIGFQVAWNYWIYVFTGNAAIVISATAYLSVFMPEINTNPVFSFFTSLAIIWGLTLLNMISIRQSAIFQMATTILKLLPLLAIICFGIFHVSPQNFTPFNASGETPLMAIIGASTITMWALLGIESATVPADHIKNPKKTIPRATLWGTIFVVLFYIIISGIIMGMIPMGILQNSSAPFADAAQILFGPMGRFLIAAGAFVAGIGALNGWIMLQGQVPLVAAKDGLFPKIFSKTMKNGTPGFGLVLSSGVITLMLMLNYNASLVDKFTFIITMATLSALIAYLFSALSSILILREKGKPLTLRFLAIPLLAFSYTIWAIIGAGQELVMIGSLLFFASSIVYVFMKIHQN